MRDEKMKDKIVLVMSAHFTFGLHNVCVRVCVCACVLDVRWTLVEPMTACLMTCLCEWSARCCRLCKTLASLSDTTPKCGGNPCRAWGSSSAQGWMPIPIPPNTHTHIHTQKHILYIIQELVMIVHCTLCMHSIRCDWVYHICACLFNVSVCVCVFWDQAGAQVCINMKGFVMEEQEHGELHNAILVENVSEMSQTTWAFSFGWFELSLKMPYSS